MTDIQTLWTVLHGLHKLKGFKVNEPSVKALLEHGLLERKTSLKLTKEGKAIYLHWLEAHYAGSPRKHPDLNNPDLRIES